MRTLAIVLAGIALVVSPVGASALHAQSLDADFAARFLGAWDVTLETPDGDMPMVLSVREQEGAVIVALGDGTAEQDPITDVTRSGEALVAAYDMEYQGMPISAEIRMTRDGEALDTEWSFADGAYVTSAEGTRR